MFQFDVFISYANEDKEIIASPLANELKKIGYRVWFDEFAISVGDSLRRSIDKGMHNAKFGIVIFSKAFFNKKWTNYELDGLIEMNVENPGILLPIWFNVSKKEVAEYSRSLSNIMAIDASKLSLSEIIQKLMCKIGEYRFSVDEDENVIQSPLKVNVPISDKEKGFQIIKNINTDQLIDQKTCVCTSDTLIYPYGDISEYKFNYWQFRKGDIHVITHVAYDYKTGRVISSTNEVLQNDGRHLLSIVHFNKISDGPVRIICKVSTTNLHSGLFSEGFSDMGFNHGCSIEYFAYYLVMPDKKDFKEIKVYVEDKEREVKRSVNQLEVEHIIRNVQPQTTTKYQFVNKAIK